jgi:DNA (cytosine-5)-methyltransferase 1
MRALDLFCGAGGATKGLQRAGFHVTGVDIKPQPHYCGDIFAQDNAIAFLEIGSLDIYDLIWASPPCQRYSVVTPRAHRNRHPDLIDKVRRVLVTQKVPYIIENVVGAPLNAPRMLCGSMFGLRTRRHRLFETNFDWYPPRKCDHSLPPLLVTTAGANSRAIGNFKSVKNAPAAYGIDWMTGDELKEAIPPTYSEWIARQSLVAFGNWFNEPRLKRSIGGYYERS